MKIKYKCGHKSEVIILDNNYLSITAFFEWNESVGAEGDKSQCWECFCKEDENPKLLEDGK